jgi:hypothetical protein
MERAKLKSLRQ